MESVETLEVSSAIARLGHAAANTASVEYRQHTVIKAVNPDLENVIQASRLLSAVQDQRRVLQGLQILLQNILVRHQRLMVQALPRSRLPRRAHLLLIPAFLSRRVQTLRIT